MITSSPQVLIVDDELHMCNVLRRILEKEGYRVITVLDGEAALQLTKEKEPDLILLDLMMPGIDGREVCRRVREFSPKTQIIYLTARAELDPLALTELRSEADAFISKPATSKQVLSKIHAVMQSTR